MTVLFFAQCADWAGARRLALDATGPVRLSALAAAEPGLSFLRGRESFVKVAVNRRLVSWDTEVSHGDEIAVMPPFSGG